MPLPKRLKSRQAAPPECDKLRDGLFGRGTRAPLPGTPNYAALVTLLLFKQRVQTYVLTGCPFSMIRTFCRFGSKRRLVATIE